ncbi:WS/DGAT domain-containing protein, partial [Saccharomonospora iraqiensis]|uniref:WS/DGAT domain-containing protein n=1 Tax=Saccharomonospora iraqiensis TaxID=52698 RepID=UPI00022DED93
RPRRRRHPAEWLTAAFAHAVREVGAAGIPGPEGGGDPHGKEPRFRLMVPWSVRGTDSLRLAGNHTGAVSVDLPVGDLGPDGRDARAARAREVAESLRSRIGAGVPEAANLVVHLLSVLPPRLHAAAARAAYRRDWFNGIGTVLPGPRRTVRWHGRVMTEAYPVLALAPGTGVAWGALTWSGVITICLTTPSPPPQHLSALAAAFHRAATTAVP